MAPTTITLASRDFSKTTEKSGVAYEPNSSRTIRNGGFGLEFVLLKTSEMAKRISVRITLPSPAAIDPRISIHEDRYRHFDSCRWHCRNRCPIPVSKVLS